MTPPQPLGPARAHRGLSMLSSRVPSGTESQLPKVVIHSLVHPSLAFHPPLPQFPQFLSWASWGHLPEQLPYPKSCLRFYFC